MDPFAPGRSYGRRSSSGPLDPRHTPGHPLYAPAASGAGGYPSPLPSSFGSSGLGRSSGLTRLPSPGDALRGPDRFERSLELPPLQNIPRSTSPILGRSTNLGNLPNLPPLSSLGPATGFGSGLYPGTSTADALTDPFAMPPPRLRRSRSRTGSIAMDTDQPDQLGSMPFGRGGRHADASLGPPSGFSEFSNFPTSGPLGNISLAGGSSSPTGDGFPSVTGEGELGPPHASRNLRKPSRRATFSTAQLNIMEDLWAQTEYPSNEQIEACATAAGLQPKQVRTWFGNTRQARLAGTRREARHAPIPGQPGTGTAHRRGRGESSSMFRPLGSGSGISPLGSSSDYLSPLSSFGSSGGFPSMSTSLGGISLTPSGDLGPLPSIASYYGPTSADPRSTGGRGPLFPSLDPLPQSSGGTGGLLPGFGQSDTSGFGGLSSGGSQRTRRRSITSYPSMNFDHGLPPPSKRY